MSVDKEKEPVPPRDFHRPEPNFHQAHIPMALPDPMSLLGFTDRWLALGVVTRERVEALGREFESSSDKNPEHYRYAAFRDYLAAHRPLQPAVAEALYLLGEAGPDRGMGGAMTRDIACLPECPSVVRDRALGSGERSLVAAVRQAVLIAELACGLTEELFDRCLTAANGAVHRALVARPELTRWQLERIAEAGANRAVRNLAAVRLRGWR
ncbi:hypothetical protein VT84_06310 [Gemmata sp. SH-PL17]|nr:hypothetical protein VT84_06310 [Gemmata sp. SH-PL17]